MAATNSRSVSVFGGNGFLGRRVVRHLRNRKFLVRITSRHPARGKRRLCPDDPQLQSVKADINDELSPLLLFWHALAWASGILPAPRLTRNQVELMQIDTLQSAEMPGFAALGISPHSVEAILQKMLLSRG
jgi:hypothetical protein